MRFSFTFGTFVGGVVSALFLGLPSPHSTLYSAVKWVTTLDDEASAPPVLHYFDVRGRAEAIRLAFADQGVEYVEQNFTGDAWGKGKADGLKARMLAEGKLAFGQVPMLEVDGLHIVQSHSILRYAARKWGWYSGYTAEQLARTDMAADGTEDVRKQLMGIKYDDALDAAAKTKAWKAWFAAEDQGGLWYGHFEKLLGRAGGAAGLPRWIGGTAQPTHADFLLFDLLDTAEALEPAGAATLLAKFPAVAAWKAKLAGRPKLAAYLSQRK